VSQGFFISFEGGEGAGKSTQIRRLSERLGERGLQVVLTREPGGSEGAESIRNLALNGAADRWSPLTESLLMYAARRDHIERRIQPALVLGQVVLCDRFADSTRAYQGAGGGVATSFIDALEANIVQDCVPNLTLIFDMPVEEGLRRAAARGDFEARFESKGLEFHQRLRDGFLKIAADQPRRCVVINAAAGDVETVAALVWAAVEPRLPQHG
jgi:dTMP kinase